MLTLPAASTLTRPPGASGEAKVQTWASSARNVSRAIASIPARPAVASEALVSARLAA